MVAIAVDDLCRDLGWVLGQPGSAVETDPPDILIRVDSDPSRVEAWVIDDYPADSLSADERRLYDIHLLTQARMLRWTYAWLRNLIVACQTRQPAELDRAAESMEQVLLVRRAAEGGKWTNWYRGDKKVDVGRWLEATRRLRDHLAED